MSPCSPAGGVRAPAAGVGGHGHRGGRGGGRVLVRQVGGAVDIVFVPLTVPVKEDYNLVVYHCDVKINK